MSEAKESGASSGRLMSLDALRGFDMFWIIGGNGVVMTFIAMFMNPLPEAVKHQFEHTDWVGFTAWDLIMPLFLFVAGTSLPFSLGKRLDRHDNKWKIYGKIARRFVILFILGMAAQGRLLEYDLGRLHIYCNTLQSIACGYVVAAVLLLNVSIAWQVVATLALLLGYWALMMFVPVPGVGAGVLTPHENLAMYVDTAILGHFRDGTPYTWILSSMTFAVSVLAGVMGGHILKSGMAKMRKFGALFALGIASLLAGWLWGFEFPIIKHIWTSSMTLWAAGWSYLLLALFYLVIDVMGFRKWAFFFVVIGSNAIVIYMAAELFNFEILSRILVGGLARQLGLFGKFMVPFGAVMIEWFILLYMYRKKTFIKV